MARQERNDVDYFPHPVNHGKKMHYILNKYKNDGYTVWFRLLEELGKADYHYLDLSDEVQIMYLASTFLVTEETLSVIIKDLVKLGEFDKDLFNKEKILFNESFRQSIKDAYKKRNNEIITRQKLISYLVANKRLKSDIEIIVPEEEETKVVSKTITAAEYEDYAQNKEREEFTEFRKSEIEQYREDIYAKLKKYNLTEPIVFASKKIPVVYLDLVQIVVDSICQDEWKVNLINRFGTVKFDDALRDFIKKIKTDFEYMNYENENDFKKHFSNWLKKNIKEYAV